MRRMLTTGLLSLALASPASALGWDDLSGALKSACGAASGGSVGGVPIGGDANLEWLCTLSGLANFVQNNILSGDWEGFASDVMGRSLTDLAHFTTSKLGFGDFGATVTALDEATRGTYQEFRRTLLSGLRRALESDGTGRKDDNAGLPASTPGGLADAYVKDNPVLNAAQTAGRLAQTAEAFRGADAAYRARKLEEQSREAVEATVKPGLESAARITGTPGRPGVADTLSDEARTALSTREVAITQARTLSEMMKQDAVTNTSVLGLLSEVARQGAMTNAELAAARERAEAGQETAENELKSYLEDVAEDTLQEAGSVARNLRGNADAATTLLDPDASSGAALGDVAP